MSDLNEFLLPPAMPDALSRATRAHNWALAARRAMDDAARVRGAAIRAARESGVPWKDIAAALGVHEKRAMNMARQ